MNRKSIWFAITLVVCVALLVGSSFTTAQASPKGPGGDKDNQPGQQEPRERDSEDKPEIRPSQELPDEPEDKGEIKGNKKDEHKKSDRVNVRGVIVTVDTAGITVQPKFGDPVTFTWGENPIIKIPTLGDTATIADLKPEMNVVVQGYKTETGVVAAKVLVCPGKPMKVHRVGTVTAYTAGTSITIEAKDGETSTFLITAETVILPETEAASLAVGSVVTIICPRDVTGGELTAKAIVIHLPEPDEEEIETPEP